MIFPCFLRSQTWNGIDIFTNEAPRDKMTIHDVIRNFVITEVASLL